jgi:hypothetical protein
MRPRATPSSVAEGASSGLAWRIDDLIRANSERLMAQKRTRHRSPGVRTQRGQSSQQLTEICPKKFRALTIGNEY